MKTILLWYGIVIILIALCVVRDAQGAKYEHPPFDVDQLLKGRDREEIPWRVLLTRPVRRTLEQRYLVNVSATIRRAYFQGAKGQSELHFVLKVADDKGRWDPGCFYTEVPAPGDSAVFTGGALYLRPGKYTVAVVAYDIARQRSSVMRREVEISPQKQEPLPELDVELPDVEFESERSEYLSTRLSDRGVSLPVNGRRPVWIDIVANVSHRVDVLELCSVLSQLAPQNGQIRVSILDTLRMQSYVDREEATGFDWKVARVKIAEEELNTVSASLLASYTPASFLVEKMDAILQPETSEPGADPPIRVVMLVSSGDLQFYKGTRIIQIIPPDNPSYHFYYINVDGYLDDDLPKMLKETNLQKIYFNWWDLRSFRKSLASLIASIETAE